MTDVTQLLQAIESGDPHAAGELLPLVYDELRTLAAHRLSREKPGQTLEATALVHEAYLRLVGEEDRPQWDHRGHFFAAAAEAMRRILVENARRKSRQKHGGELHRAEVDVDRLVGPMPDDELLALDEALTKLALEDPLKARLVQLRFFAGLTNEHAAEVMGISPVSAKRYWRYARAWLHARMAESNSSDSTN